MLVQMPLWAAIVLGSLAIIGTISIAAILSVVFQDKQK